MLVRPFLFDRQVKTATGVVGVQVVVGRYGIGRCMRFAKQSSNFVAMRRNHFRTALLNLFQLVQNRFALFGCLRTLGAVAAASPNTRFRFLLPERIDRPINSRQAFNQSLLGRKDSHQVIDVVIMASQPQLILRKREQLRQHFVFLIDQLNELIGFLY